MYRKLNTEKVVSSTPALIQLIKHFQIKLLKCWTIIPALIQLAIENNFPLKILFVVQC